MSEKAKENTSEEAAWTGRKVGSAFQHKIFYFLIRIGGRWMAYSLLYIVVLWYAALYPSIRRNTAPYLSRRFPQRTYPWQRLFDRYRLCLTYGKVLVDRAVAGILGKGSFQVTFPNEEELLGLLQADKGLILLHSHVGCWQIAVAAMNHLNCPVAMVMHKNQFEVDRTYFEQAGVRTPYSIIDPEGEFGGVFEMLSVLKSKEVLCIMGDRVFGASASAADVEFLGDRARFPIAAMKLATAYGSPIGVLLSHRVKAGVYELRLVRILHCSVESTRKKSEYAKWLREYVETLEDYAEEHPWQFFNFYDMWER